LQIHPRTKGGGEGAELETYLVQNDMEENLTFASTSVHDFFLISYFLFLIYLFLFLMYVLILLLNNQNSSSVPANKNFFESVLVGTTTHGTTFCLLSSSFATLRFLLIIHNLILYQTPQAEHKDLSATP